MTASKDRPSGMNAGVGESFFRTFSKSSIVSTWILFLEGKGGASHRVILEPAKLTGIWG